MKKWPIALQVSSIRADVKESFEGTMRKVKAMGYDGVELAGTCGMTAVECRKILDEIGLALMGAHVQLKQLEDPAVLDDYCAAGLKFIAIPWVQVPTNEEEVNGYIARFRAVGEACKARGMQLLYHNHDYDFKKIDGKYVLDRFYEGVPADLLQTQLDVCWVNVGGENPSDYLRKYAGRAPILHLKDFAGRKNEKTYALIGIDAGDEEANGEFQFRPLGKGLQNIPDILDAAVDAGVQWLVVEQDRPSMGKTALECAEMSVQYLHSL